jgi:cytochrome c oxidase accessory protein FixG
LRTPAPPTRELPWDRLATTDAQGHRVWLYPADVRGAFRRMRTALSALLILLFLALPWAKVQGQQALWIDVLHGRFVLFGQTFWAHELPALFLVVGGALATIAFVTAIWGRAWCGWACPQTVFVDQVFRRIERVVEGDGVARRRLDQSPWSAAKLGRKTAKWVAFTAISLLLAHSFLAYFIGTGQLAGMMQASPARNPGSFLAMAAMTALVLFDFGWFREQFCTLVCPYGRFQSVLMDDRSLAVAYDAARGEPRAAGGDCVNCYRCVQVCPTGIDIRRGLQLECVACTACVDACDEVMKRLHKPPRLIRYQRQAKGTGARARILAVVTLGFAVGLGAFVAGREPLAASILRKAGNPYEVLPGSDEVVNHFKAELRNQGSAPVRVAVAAVDPRVSLVLSNYAELLQPGESERADLFIRFPKSLLAEGKAGTAVRISIDGARALEKGVALVGPYR